jgi:chromosome segregation ATPase
MSKQLQEQRAQLVRELHAAEDKLAGLQREHGRAMQRSQDDLPRYMPNEGGSNRTQVRVISEPAKLGMAISSLKSDISDYRRQLAELDRAISFATEVEQAEATHQGAISAHEHAKGTLSSLRSAREELAVRLEQLRTEADLRLDRASQCERNSADVYTEALKVGSSDTASASDKMRQASVDLALAKQEHAGQQKVFDVLKAELDTLDEQIDQAEHVAEEAAKAVHRAVAVKLGITWDKQVSKIVSLGSELLAVRKAAGLPVDALRDISIPRFSTFRAKAIGVRELEEAASKRIA